MVYLLPIVWMPSTAAPHLLVGLFCMDLALMVPICSRRPQLPASTWRQVVILVVRTTMVASTIRPWSTTTGST